MLCVAVLRWVANTPRDELIHCMYIVPYVQNVFMKYSMVQMLNHNEIINNK